MKLTSMQQKYLIRAALILLLVAGSYLVLFAASKNASDKENCSESMEDCSKTRKDGGSSGEIIWETLSRQFISSTASSN
jgi:hypothetical protein